MKIGVLAVQGNFREHAAMLRRLGANAVEVRKPEQLQGLDGLVIPGGESTTFISRMNVVDSPPGITSPSRPCNCSGLRTSTASAPSRRSIAACSRKFPCTARTPIFIRLIVDSGEWPGQPTTGARRPGSRHGGA